MLINFEPFHKERNSEEGKKDYFLTRITGGKKVKTCCECLFTIAEGEEHHQAVGFWHGYYSDRRTCLRCHELIGAMQETSIKLQSMNDFRFGSLPKRVKALRQNHPNEFRIFEDEYDLTDIIKCIEKKKGWRDAPMQLHAKVRTNSNFITCCQCLRDLPPRTQYEEATITENHKAIYNAKTCLKCVEKRKILEPHFACFHDDIRLLYMYRSLSIKRLLSSLSRSDLAKPSDSKALQLLDDYVAANRRLRDEAEEEFKVEVERRKCGFTPPSTRYEFQLKSALEEIGYTVIHNEPLGYYFPDLLLKDQGCIVEVDGDWHLTDHQQAKDEYRTHYLNSQGYFVLRVSNDRVAAGLRSLVKDIKKAIDIKENAHLG